MPNIARIPEFDKGTRVGDPMFRARLNALVRAANCVTAVPGMFKNGELCLRYALSTGGESSTSGESNLRWARVHAEITAATSNLQPDWGAGSVRFMSDATGELDADPTDVVNCWVNEAFAADVQVLVDTARDPPRVVTATCGVIASWEESLPS